MGCRVGEGEEGQGRNGGWRGGYVVGGVGGERGTIVGGEVEENE